MIRDDAIEIGIIIRRLNPLNSQFAKMAFYSPTFYLHLFQKNYTLKRTVNIWDNILENRGGNKVKTAEKWVGGEIWGASGRKINKQ